MKAIYKGKLYDLGDELQQCELREVDTGIITSVSFGDPELIIDPTDDEINNILPDAD